MKIFSFYHGLYYKDKAIPVSAWTGPEVSRRLTFPDFMTSST